MLVGARMLYPSWTIGPRETVETAADLMENNRMSWLPVVDRQSCMLGVISSDNIKKAEKSSEDEKYVEDFMTTELLSVTEDTTIEEAARIITDYDLPALPVLRDGFLVGVVTKESLVRVLMEMTGARVQGVRVMFKLLDRRGALLDVLQIIYDRGGSIEAISSYCANDELSAVIVTMRVQGMDKFALKQAIRDSAAELIDIR